MGKKGQKNKAQNDQKKQSPSSQGFPRSLLHYDNKKQKSKFMSVETLVPSAVFVARNFMNQKECNSWIRYAEETIGFETLCRQETREYAQRECGRISKTDWEMADQLFERMKDVIGMLQTQVLISHSDPSYAPVACNGNLRLYRYEKNMSFGKHFDGSERISRFNGGNTEITVLVYLSSCVGGATRFYLPTSAKKKKGNTTNDEGIAFVPEAGAILMHIHGDRCLEHEADPVLDGVKYVLRTDIVYAPSAQSASS